MGVQGFPQDGHPRCALFGRGARVSGIMVICLAIASSVALGAGAAVLGQHQEAFPNSAGSCFPGARKGDHYNGELQQWCNDATDDASAMQLPAHPTAAKAAAAAGPDAMIAADLRAQRGHHPQTSAAGPWQQGQSFPPETPVNLISVTSASTHAEPKHASEDSGRRSLVSYVSMAIATICMIVTFTLAARAYLDPGAWVSEADGKMGSAVKPYYWNVFAFATLVMMLLPSLFLGVAKVLHEEGVCIGAALASLVSASYLVRQFAGLTPSTSSAPGSEGNAYAMSSSGVVLGGVTLSLFVGYFAMERLGLGRVSALLFLMPTRAEMPLKAFLAGECLWQLSMAATTICVAHVVLSEMLKARAGEGRYGLRIGAALTISTLYTTLLPFVNIDRMPMFFQPRGCPSVMYYVFAAFAACTALSSIREGSVVQYSFSKGAFQVRLAQLRSDVVVNIPSDLLAVLAATTSFVYLTCLVPALIGYTASHVVYHLAWTYLRPTYTVVFIGYILKAWPQKAHPIYLLMCYFGVLHFGLFGPLADTERTHMKNEFCDADGIRHPFSYAVEDYATYDIGVSFHGTEAMGFLFSMILYVWSGVRLKAWGSRTEMLIHVSMLGALLVNVVSRARSISRTGWFAMAEVWPAYELWFLTRYVFGYGVILCAGTWKILTH